MEKQQNNLRKIVAIDEKRQQKKTKKNMHQKAVWRRVAFLHTLLIAIAVAVSGTLLLQIVGHVTQAQEIDARIVEAKAQETKVQNEQKSLQQQVELLQQDDYIAKLARSEYYLSKSGEIIFNTPQDAAVNKLQQAQASSNQ